MPRLPLALLIVIIAGLTLSAPLAPLAGAYAQTSAFPEPGDPPVASLISVSPPDEEGIVTISGAAGAVFPVARLAIRNLYTEETVYLQATVTGTFTARLYGPGNTPFWISPASANIPNELLDQPGSLPGGPGTIVYGPFPETRAITEAATRLLIDGDLSDWDAYPQSALGGEVRALRNRESLYLAAPVTDAAALEFVITVNGTTFALTYDPHNPQSALVRRTQPDAGEPFTIPIAAAQDEGVEVRLLLTTIRQSVTTIALNAVRALDADGSEVSSQTLDAPLEPTDEVDGIARPDSPLGDEYTRFMLAGALAQGAGVWSARARIDRLNVGQRETPVILEMDVTVDAPELAEDALSPRMIGEIGLQPVYVARADGAGFVAADHTNNGWSNVLTRSGLAIDNLRGDILLAETEVAPPQVIQREDGFVFGMDFTLRIPAAIPDGLYVPYFRGYIEQDGARAAWEANGFFGAGDGISRAPLTRMPIVLNVGGVEEARLLWTLFQDDPSDGSRGVLADEDRDAAALSNRTRFNSATYILPPANAMNGEANRYPLEPYLLAQTPNLYDSSAAPLIPFFFPGGRLNARVERPDGTVDDLGSAPILQGQLSSTAMDERIRFGEQTQVDTYRLTTLNPLFGDYVFDQYGEYTITVTGNLEDIWGNRYAGGGTYRVLAAEQLDLTPGVLPGTPFEVGDAFNSVLHVAPAAPADVTITVRVYPLDGSRVRENVLHGQANRYGYFYTNEEILRFDTPGEYVIDYEARYTDAQGRLWAGSLRSAGVIARADSAFIAHGERGMDGTSGSPRPAWYSARQYARVVGAPESGLRPYAPYHGGDVAWTADGRNGGLTPVVRVQNTAGLYQDWLERIQPGASARTRRDELPATIMNADGTADEAALLPERIVNEAYTYLSVVRPGVAARQMVVGADDGGLPLYLSGDDPLNEQIGAGFNGDLPGDYLFIFGGAVVRNDAAETRETAIYGATAVVIDGENDTQGARVFPPYWGKAGGPNGGSLLTIRGDGEEIFFVPTGAQPGQSLLVGETLSIAGQVAPALPSIVEVTVTSPSSIVRQFAGIANPVGYFYDPDNDFPLNEPGVWTVDITVRHEGETSAGVVQPPLPEGGIPGAPDGRFFVYALPEDAETLPWERTDFIFPAALPYNFNFLVPEGWTNTQVQATLWMPGFLLESAPVRVTGNNFTYQYAPNVISRDFPNFEDEGRVDGAGVSDPLVLTLVATGTDAEGRFQIRSRVFDFRHERIMTGI